MEVKKRKPNRRKTEDLRLKIEPELRGKMEVIAARQRRSVPSLAYFYVAEGAERDADRAGAARG